MNDKKIVWIDMDGVLVDFNGHVEETISKNEFLKTAYKQLIKEGMTTYRVFSETLNQLKELLKQLRN